MKAFQKGGQSLSAAMILTLFGVATSDNTLRQVLDKPILTAVLSLLREARIP